MALVQGSGFVGTARIAIGLTGIGLLIVAAFMSGGIRSRSQAARTAHLPIVPSAQEAVLSEWRQEGLVSEVSDVALIYGGILTAVGALLYVVPGA